jgi:glycine betaine/choline ABC-type transport system substrate-binding protein
VSQTLTTADLTDLNKQVSIDRRDAKDVAGDYLKTKNLVR